jgi:riboflavin biosynthesis pyrimidine reductase
LRIVTFNIATMDGRIAVSRSTPSMLDSRWRPLDRFEPVDVLSLHKSRVSLEGSSSFARPDAPPAYRLFLLENDVPYFEAGDDRVDLSQALGRLGEVFGEECVVSDAGGILNGAFLRAGLVDEIDIQFLPVVIGRADAPAIFDGYDLGASGSISIRDLQLISAEGRPDGSLFVRYVPAKPSPRP